MSYLDVRVPGLDSAPTYGRVAYTVTFVGGQTWTTPADQPHSYTIDAGVLSVFPIDESGLRRLGARHYSPGRWVQLVEEEDAAGER